MPETEPASGEAAPSSDQIAKARVGKPPLREKGGVADEPFSVIDEKDASAWAIPYTDLTMLLLVFFVIMLSQAEPAAIETADAGASADWLVERMRAAPDCPETPPPAPSILEGGAGALPIAAAAGRRADDRPDLAAEEEPQAEREEGGATEADAETDIETDRPPEPEAALAAEWARRVGALEALAAPFLKRNDLLGAVDLVRTETGIEFRMSDDLLFRSGDATLEAPGAALIGRLAPLLRDIPGDIEVSGHTDDRPIRTARFPSNWELSAARAISVVRRLRDLGVPETTMKAVGHGANRPVASNDDPAGRARNRRVAIRVTPRLPRL